MPKKSVRPTDYEIENTVKEYSNTLFKLCFAMLGNNADAEDAVSNTLIRYITSAPDFKEPEHKKAWLLRVAANMSKDMLRFRKRREYISLDDASDYCEESEELCVFEQLLRLPDKYRAVIHLFYVEGYKTDEIAKMLSVSCAAVRKRLQYGREKLKLEYEKECLS